MQLSNWAAVLSAVETYDDAVLAEAARFAEHLLSKDSYHYDTAPLSAALSADPDEIGSDWQRECWQNAAMETAIEQYEDEHHYEALRSLVSAMLTRSNSWGQAFT